MAERALLIVNPTATSTTKGTRLVVERALRSALDVEVAQTQSRGEGAALAAQSTHDLIVVLGGDGTVNDVTTGLIDFATGRSRGSALAVIPGGSTNVFARALGIPSDPIEATAQLLAAVEERRQRTISIGALKVGEELERTFLFSAGMGVDGKTVALMEKSRRPFGLPPRSISPVRYGFATLLSLAQMQPELQIFINETTVPLRAALAIVTTNPVWTYLGDQPLSLTPRASFETGLGLFTMQRVDPKSSAEQLWKLARRGIASGPGTTAREDLSTVVITSASPLPVQADGEALSSATTLRMRTLRAAMTVLV